MNNIAKRYFESPHALTIAQLAGWTAYALSTYLTLLPSIADGQHAAMFVSKLARGAVGLAASYVLLFIYRSLRSRAAAPATVLVTAVAACSVLGTSWMLLYRGLIAPNILVAAPLISRELIARASLDMIFVLLAWSGLYFAVSYWRQFQQHERSAIEARQLAQQAQFEMLSYQLNPHFLFNALNSIRAMIAEDSDRAKEMVTQFSAFLRYTLANDPTRRVTLAEEFDMVSGYLAIEGIRLDDRLDARAELQADAADCLIPPFVVHPLVENAIKHGRAPNNEPLRVRVSATRTPESLRIMVANSGHLSNAPSDGIGWRNVQQRLQLVYGSASDCRLKEESGWVIATLNLPTMLRASLKRA